MNTAPSPDAVDPNEQLTIAVVDTSQARREQARDAADARLSNELDPTNTRGFRGFVKRLWKGNYANEYYRQKYSREELAKIDESGNLYAGEAGMDSREAMGATVDRFTSEYADQVLHGGEKRRELEDGRDDPMRTSIFNLVGAYARDELDDNNFEEEKNRVISELSRGNPQEFGEGTMFADNLLEIAQNVKAKVAHGIGLDQILDTAKIVVGEARMGVRSEAKYNRVDKIVERLQRTKVGALVNEATLSTAAAVVASVTKFGSRWGTGKAAAIATGGVLGVAGGALAAARESKKVKQERTQHMRERAQGKEFASGAEKRSRFEQTRYETRGAADLAGGLNELFDDQGKLKDINNPDEYQAALTRLAEVHARIDMSDTQGIDLIHFSGIDKVDSERLQLDLARARVNVALKDTLDGRQDELLPPGLRTSSFEDLLSMHERTFTASQEQQIQDRDRVFAKMRHNEVSKAGVKAFTVGMVVGVAAQEVMAALPGTGGGSAGVFESPGGNAGEQQSTLLRSIFRGDSVNAQLAPNGEGLQHFTLSENTGLNLPEGYSAGHDLADPTKWAITGPDGQHVTDVVMNPDGSVSQQTLAALEDSGMTLDESLIGIDLSGETRQFDIGSTTYSLPVEYNALETAPGQWDIVNASDGSVLTHFNVSPDGTLSPQAMEFLESNGVSANTITETELIVTHEEIPAGSAQEFIDANADQTQAVHRVLWYGNDTPGDYDLNELRTHAGGVNGDWFDEQGNVVIDISHMTPDGSFQGGAEADPFTLVGENRLTAAISVSKDTQATTFNFDFVTTPDGRTVAIIPPDDPAYQLFQAGNEFSGHGAFNGRYIEIMEHTGQLDEQGEQVRILGTYVGESDMNGLTTGGTHTTEVTTHTTTLGIETAETVQTLTLNSAEIQMGGVEPLIPIPITSRRGLETPKSRLRRGYEYGMYGEEDEEAIEELIRMTMPELQRNPRSRVSIGDATKWYRDLLGRERGEDYASEIEDIIESSTVLSEIDSTTRAIVAIPVAGTKEGGNIFQTLSLYGQQPDEAQAATKILLHVNWTEDGMQTPEDRANLDYTMSEIARAQAAFPGLNIATMQTQWANGSTPNGVIGHAARKLFDAAILASRRAVEEGRISEDHDIALIRNDSDAKGMASDYLNRMTSATLSDGVDAVSGKIRWGIEQVRDMPGLSLVTQFMEGLGGSAERAKAKGIRASIDTIGINTGVRISTLAAVGSIGFSSWTGAASDDLAVGRRIRAVRSKDSYFNQRSYGGKRSWRDRILRRRQAGYAGTTEPDDIQDDGVVKATGTIIDSDVSRLERAYRAGKPIVASWDDWNGTDRAAGLSSGRKGEKGDDIDTLTGRLEFHINAIINSWGTDSAHAEMEFHRLFPPARDWEDDEYKGEVYEFTVDTDGNKSFSFTDSGKKLLQKRLERNNRGKYDPMGSRRLRVNYGQVPRRGKLKPPNTPRLLRALS